MPSVTETVSVMNSAIRTLMTLGIVGALGAGGWYGYQQFTARDQEAKRVAEALADAQGKLERANVLINEQKQEIERLDTSLRLLKVNHRIAQLTVLDQTTDADSGEIVSLVQFQELDDQGKTVGEPQQFSIRGDLVYIDSWVVKFDDKYVEQADIDRSTSLVLFRRIFGEFQEPNDGFSLDEAGSRPTVYARGSKMSDFEKRIWDDFWAVANDEKKQEQLGVRAAHGDAPSIKVQKGKAYRVELRASDGLSITPEGNAPVPQKPAA